MTTIGFYLMLKVTFSTIFNVIEFYGSNKKVVTNMTIDGWEIICDQLSLETTDLFLFIFFFQPERSAFT